MSKKKRLRVMAQLIYDARSSDLARAAKARDHVQEQINSLNVKHTPNNVDLTVSSAAYHYEAWAAVRRAELGRLLALRQAKFLNEKQKLSTAFSRVETIKRLP